MLLTVLRSLSCAISDGSGNEHHCPRPLEGMDADMQLIMERAAIRSENILEARLFSARRRWRLKRAEYLPFNQ